MISVETSALWRTSPLIVVGRCGIVTSTGASENVTLEQLDILRAPPGTQLEATIRIALPVPLTAPDQPILSGTRYGFSLAIPPLDTGVYRLHQNDRRGIVATTDPEAPDLIQRSRQPP